MASDPPDTDQAVRRVPHRRVRNPFPTAPSDDAVGLGLFGRPSRDGDPAASQTRPPPATPALVSLDGHGTGPPPGGWGIYDAAPPGGILAGSVASHADLARMLPHYASGVILPATPNDPFASPAGVAAAPSPSPTLTPAPARDIAWSETRAWADQAPGRARDPAPAPPTPAASTRAVSQAVRDIHDTPGLAGEAPVAPQGRPSPLATLHRPRAPPSGHFAASLLPSHLSALSVDTLGGGGGRDAGARAWHPASLAALPTATVSGVLEFSRPEQLVPTDPFADRGFT
jgi:hypothetical protein